MFRLKQGCSFRHLELLFGWSSSSIAEWYYNITDIIDVHMKMYHLDFMQNNFDVQTRESTLFKLRHLEKNDWLSFVDRIKQLNADARRNGYPNMFPVNNAGELLFQGSIGATDCSYSLRPNIERSVLLTNNEDCNIGGQSLYLRWI